MKIDYQGKFFALNKKLTDLKQETDELQGRLNEKQRVLREDHFQAKKDMIATLDADL